MDDVLAFIGFYRYLLWICIQEQGAYYTGTNYNRAYYAVLDKTIHLKHLHHLMVQIQI